MLIRICFILALLFSVILIGSMPGLTKPPLEVAVKRQLDRNTYIRFEAIIDSLDITPGMTILDIGAGPGYASFVFAEKLHGSGKVLATDIRADFVEYLAAEAGRRGLTNLFPAAVTEKGFDEFYTGHRYDLVFIANVYHVLENRIEYFRKLRGYLNPDARVVLVLYHQAPLFCVDDFVDLDGVINILSSESEGAPFTQHLAAGTKHLLGQGRAARGLASALVDDFNRILTDPHFFEDFYDGSYFRKDIFTDSERDMANWLLMLLKENGTPETPREQIDDKELRTVVKLNRLFFQSRFGKYLANGGKGAYIPAGDANRHSSKYEMMRELNAAGYTFAKEMELSPYFDAIIMVPVAP